MRVVAMVAAVVLLAGCGGSGSDEPSAGPTGNAREFPGGQQLSHYKNMASYEWRVAIVEHQDELLEDMQAIAPWPDEGDLSAVVSTCASIAAGGNAGEQLHATVVRFSGGPDETVSGRQAQQLLDLARAEVCGGVG